MWNDTKVALGTAGIRRVAFYPNFLYLIIENSVLSSTVTSPISSSVPVAPPPGVATPNHFLADLYAFHWTELNLRLPLVSSIAVALCLFVGLWVGHPSGGLIAGGGAFTVGFGANQRIADSRLWPMLAAIFACGSATFAGTVVGHNGYALVLAASGSAFIYGVLTAQNTGLSWVGQQASVALFVASAFPSAPRAGLVRAGLIFAGGAAQLVITSVGLRLLPELQKNLFAIPHSVYSSLATTLQIRRHDLLHRLHDLPLALPGLSTRESLIYSLRLVLTVAIGSEFYRHLGIRSGYWIPMTALLVQKPAFFETFTRAASRILGTVAGAWLCTLLLAHVSLTLPAIAAAATLFAFLSFATNAVNYGLFTACLTSYIVFLLSLNQMPAPDIAHRRAWCTILGGLIALLIHLDAIRRLRSRHLDPSTQESHNTPSPHIPG